MPKSRCEICNQRIGKSRYPIGLCRSCEQIEQALRAMAMTVMITRLVTDPEIIKRIEQLPEAMRQAIQTAIGSPTSSEPGSASA